MSKSYTARQAIINAVDEMYSSAERLGTCEVIHGPMFAAYEDSSGATRLDILFKGAVRCNLTLSQAHSYAKEFLVSY